MHVLPIAVAAGERTVAESVLRRQDAGEKKTLCQIVSTEGALAGVVDVERDRRGTGRRLLRVETCSGVDLFATGPAEGVELKLGDSGRAWRHARTRQA